MRLSDAFEDGEALYAAARKQGLEGVVAKKADSRYLPGRRTRDWLKVKTHQEQEFVIAGYTKGRGKRAGRLGSLVLGVNRAGELDYVGNCGTGFSDDEIDKLMALLRPLERKTAPFADVPKMPKVRRDEIVWVEPALVCEVEFAEWTHDGRLRAPVYKGLREDKPAADVRREQPLETEIRRGRRVLRLSNLDKPFWPEEGITKGDLIAYYREIAPVVLPHLHDRPFTMKRFPDGWQGKHFFQKDAPSHMPKWIPTRAYRSTSRETRQKRTIRYPLVNDELALLWMANMGCIDLNTWYSRVDRPERPDWVLFDLDPSPDVGFAEVVQVALLIKDVLDALGLVGFPKTSGADGLHVLVPDRAPVHLRPDARVRRDRRRDPGAAPPRARDDGVGEGEASRRPDRREPERRGEDDRDRLLGAPPPGRARLDPAPLGRGHRGPRARPVHHGGRARPGRARGRPVRRTCSTTRQSLGRALRELR